MMKKIKAGVQSFDLLMEGDYYYVDKTDLIADVVENPFIVHLFTRPRRFGKSLMLSTLDCFFNQRYKGETWFDGLKVSEHRECDVHRNAYPVIKMDFKELGDTYESFIDDMRGRISELFAKYDEDFYKCLNESDRSLFREIRDRSSTEGDLKSSLAFLSRILRDRYGKRTVILIDEYDDPIHKTYGTMDSQKVLGFMRGMLSAALKGNDNLQFAVVTGVMQIAKEAFFSGLNNPEVNNVFTEEFGESFGFTDDEVRAMCRYYAGPKGRDPAEAFAEAKEWYDGYLFGGRGMYNPWSILKYISGGFKPDTYWANTSGNAIINSMLDIADDTDWRNMVKLSDGGEVSAGVSKTVTMADLGDSGSIYSVMVMGGYLTARFGEGGCLLSIPNKEVRQEFGRIMAKRIAAKADNVNRFIEAMVSGDAATMGDRLRDILMDNIGSLSLDSERSYNMAIACMLIDRDGALSVASEMESGNGRPDIALRSNRAGTPNIIMELKKADSSSSAERAMALAGDAIRQIHEKRYYHGMRGDTILYGMAFRGKEPHIAMERITL